MQTQDFYRGSTQPDLRPLSFNFNSKFEVSLFQDFQTNFQAIQLDYGSNPLSWTLGFKHPLQSSRDTIEQPLK